MRSLRPRPILSTLLPLLLVPLASCGGTPDTEIVALPTPVDLDAEAEAAQELIDETVLREPISVLADDSMEGRLPGSAGDRRVREELAARLKALGLEPGGQHGGWEQPFTLIGTTARPPEAWTLETRSGAIDLRVGHEYIAVAGGDGEAVLRDAELVFVGYGISAPEEDWEDYETDVSGKVVVVLNNDPDWDPDLFAGPRRLYYGRWRYKNENAARHGAVGAVIVHTTPSAGYGWNVIQSSWTGERFELPGGSDPRLAVEAWTTEAATRRLLQRAGHDLDQLVEAARSRDFKPVPLGIRTSLTIPVEHREISTANVLGLLRGRDETIGNEVVVLTAHHDHIGRDPTVDGDGIYNGALDNASGVAQVLAVARAFSALTQPPRRSILFAFVAAEEQGLLGSTYYAAQPTFPPGRIAAVVNFDGGNIWGRTRDVTFIGYEKSSLGPIVERFAREQGRTVRPDQFPDKGAYYRSDQFPFARIGVPGIYLDTGTDFIGRPEGWGHETIDAWEAAHYHQPSDELTADWVFDGMVEDARIGFRAAVVIAEADDMPTWTPGDEFEAAREAAQQALQ